MLFPVLVAVMTMFVVVLVAFVVRSRGGLMLLSVGLIGMGVVCAAITARLGGGDVSGLAAPVPDGLISALSLMGGLLGIYWLSRAVVTWLGRRSVGRGQRDGVVPVLEISPAASDGLPASLIDQWNRTRHRAERSLNGGPAERALAGLLLEEQLPAALTALRVVPLDVRKRRGVRGEPSPLESFGQVLVLACQALDVRAGEQQQQDTASALRDLESAQTWLKDSGERA